MKMNRECVHSMAAMLLLLVVVSCHVEQETESSVDYLKMMAYVVPYGTTTRAVNSSYQDQNLDNLTSVNFYVTDVENGVAVGNSPHILRTNTGLWYDASGDGFIYAGFVPQSGGTNIYYPDNCKKVNILGLIPTTVLKESETFSVQENQTTVTGYKASDLMYAYIENVARTDYPIPIGFSHLLCKIVVNVTTSSGIEFASVTLKNVYRTIDIDPQTGTLGEGNTLADQSDVVMSPNGGAVIPPQAVGGEFFEVTTSEGKSAIFFLEGLNFVAGKRYTFTLNVESDDLGSVKAVPTGEEEIEETTTYFNYTGNEQRFTVGKSGRYQLEVWGGQGGSVMAITNYKYGGKGGYSKGVVTLNAGTTLYINVGGAGEGAVSSGVNVAGGYNGGGSVTASTGVNHFCSGGGGATHIATASGLLSSLANNKGAVLIVAGGGGGGRDQVNRDTGVSVDGGAGGGLSGGNPPGWGINQSNGGYPGTQTSGYSFGIGRSVTGQSAGGGGWYGGGATSAGYGGSGYIGYDENGNLMSTVGSIHLESGATTTAGVNEGNGYAIITYLGE